MRAPNRETPGAVGRAEGQNQKPLAGSKVIIHEYLRPVDYAARVQIAHFPGEGVQFYHGRFYLLNPMGTFVPVPRSALEPYVYSVLWDYFPTPPLSLVREVIVALSYQALVKSPPPARWHA